MNIHIYLLKKNSFSSAEPYSVIPVYSTPEQQQRVPRNTNETEESVEKIDEAVSRLSHLMLTGLYQPEVDNYACNPLSLIMINFGDKCPFTSCHCVKRRFSIVF